MCNVNLWSFLLLFFSKILKFLFSPAFSACPKLPRLLLPLPLNLFLLLHLSSVPLPTDRSRLLTRSPPVPHSLVLSNCLALQRAEINHFRAPAGSQKPWHRRAAFHNGLARNCYLLKLLPHCRRVLCKVVGVWSLHLDVGHTFLGSSLFCQLHFLSVCTSIPSRC